MKHRFSFLTAMLAVIISAISMQSCDNSDPDVIWDIAPICFHIYVENAAGDNLLSDNAFVANSTLTYDDKTTPVEESVEGRAYMPNWRGAVLTTDRDGRRCIEVGQFDGAGDYSDEFVLTLGGKSYTFSFSTEDKYKGDDVKFKRHYYLDGRKIPPYDNSGSVSHTIVL